MGGDGAGSKEQTGPLTPVGAGIQANLARATSFAGQTRDWSIYMFFKVLSQAQMASFLQRIAGLKTEAEDDAQPPPNGSPARQRAQALAHQMANPGLMEYRVSKPPATEPAKGAPPAAPSPPPSDGSGPAEQFKAWLRLLVNADMTAINMALGGLVRVLGGNPPANLVLDADALDRLRAVLPHDARASDFDKALALLADTARSIEDAGKVDHVAAGRAAIGKGLIGIVMQEVLRQLAPAKAKEKVGLVRGEGEAGGAGPYDPAAINIAFTYKGLEALKLDEDTLLTFPDVFREGMAARAVRLGDTGPSAPENWYGELGQPSVHGYFTGGFLVDGATPADPASASEAQWREARRQVREFNERTPLGQKLRAAINLIYRLFGLEIVHIELGQDPYLAKPDNSIEKLPWRQEHFGFRDGLSQPFVDLGLDMPAPGGGTPRRNQTWAPVASGEIFLGLPDEDGAISAEPAQAQLRHGGTYLVFRKLEQDVVGLRDFLARQRPHDKAAQDRLGAEMIGRWKSGAPLVKSPDRDLPGVDLNNFLYMADDPKGMRCPLSAHIRRANPRDIGGRDDVRRHRLLRRGISYGGPLLPEDSAGDGEERGLLFICANSRIDLQFEVVQADWLNTGEFLGQAGLARCPVVGANNGGLRDTFLEAGKGVPVTGVPRFVITRGGDYFFMPSVKALKELAAGSDFPMDPRVNDEMLYRGYSYGDPKSRELFDEERIRGFVQAIAFAGKTSIPMDMPSSEWGPTAGAGSTTGAADARIVFVGKNADAWAVLDGLDASGDAVFTTEHYATASRRLTQNNEFIIGTDRKPEKTSAARQRLHNMLKDAWTEFDRMLRTKHKIGIYAHLGGIVNSALEGSLRRVCRSGRIDLIRDLPTEAAWRVSADFIGIPGPEDLTQLALTLPFAKRRIGELPRDWLRAMKGEMPDNPALTNLQVWSAVIFADLVGNVTMRRDLAALAAQAAGEFFGHIDEMVANASTYNLGRMPTLLDAFIALAPAGAAPRRQYFTDMRVLLAELSGSAIGIIPGVFGSVMETAIDNRIDLAALVPLLERPIGAEATGIPRFLYEITRAKPSIPLIMRRCRKDTVLPSKAVIRKGEWVGVLLAAAGLDDTPFPRPLEFSLHPWLPGPPRAYDSYFLFGAKGGDRECWGRDRMALFILTQCVRAASTLTGLSRIAGTRRNFDLAVGAKVGLRAKFSPFTYTGKLPT